MSFEHPDFTPEHAPSLAERLETAERRARDAAAKGIEQAGNAIPAIVYGAFTRFHNGLRKVAERIPPELLAVAGTMPQPERETPTRPDMAGFLAAFRDALESGYRKQQEARA